MSQPFASLGAHTHRDRAHRTDRFVEHNHDAYRADKKLNDRTTCGTCHATVHEGRWQWRDAPQGATVISCPACRRIADHFAAGYVAIEGDFFARHRVEIIDLITTHARRAEAGHPLRRLMSAEDTPEGVMVTTTDTHLAREIGTALHDAYDGKVSFSYADAQELLRVHWSR